MKKLFIIMIFGICIISIIKVSATDNSFPLLGKIIVVDPGHGGADAGTSSGKLLEKDINLSISIKLKEKIESLGGTAILTRDGDYDLSNPNANRRKKSDFDNRIRLINNSGADLFISIHLNYYTNSAYSGPQVFYYPVFNKNKSIALIFQNKLNKFTHGTRNIKINNTAYMYKKLNVPGVLLECGFLSNPSEAKKLNSSNYQNDLVLVIVSAIINI